MQVYQRRSFVLAAALACILSTGCEESGDVLGLGGLLGMSTTSSSVTGSTAEQPRISAPTYSLIALDPEVEATAGAKVVVVADMDGDGLNDVVSGSNESQPIQLHMRTGAALEYDTFSIAGGGPIASMVDLKVDDFDADGNPDVAVLVQDTGFVPVDGASIRGAVVLLFAPSDPRDNLDWEQIIVSETFDIPGAEPGMTCFAIADMNGDGESDIVLGSNEVDDTDLIRLFFNPGGANARNSLAWTQTTEPIEYDVNFIQDLAIADIDGDGDNDVVATFPTAKTFNIRWLRNPLKEAGFAAVQAGDWDSRMLGQQAEVEPDNQGGDEIAVGDIDGDGDIDVAAAHAGLGLIQWFENPGAGRVEVQRFPWNVYNVGQLSVTGVTINQIQLVDMDLNGTLDIFATASGNMIGYQRQADVYARWAGFSILATNPVADIGRTAFSDVDGDGRLDMIAPFDRAGIDNDNFLIFRRN